MADRKLALVHPGLFSLRNGFIHSSSMDRGRRGGVLVFVRIAHPLFFLALLEDSGYMSRAAFVMDRSCGCRPTRKSFIR